MKKSLLTIVIAILFSTGGFAQSKLWSSSDAQRVSSAVKNDRVSIPVAFKLFELDYAALKQQLATSPARFSGAGSDVIISFPDAKGKLNRYTIYESSVMHPDLASRFPEIQSYVGYGIDNPAATIRFTTTIFGLHAMTFTPEGVSYIDPHTKDLATYIIYDKKDLLPGAKHECLVEDEPVDAGAFRSTESQLASDGQFRTYRLAMASTIEYSAYHISAAGVQFGTLAQKKAAVLAAINVTVSRLNGVYEKDMSLRMVLVPNNDAIIYVTTDSFDNANASNLINQSQTVIDANIGSANYDIGHTVSTGGGGLAQSPSVCSAGSKARGITGSPAPVGDAYDIDFVAHEIGHQFGASHTFNGVTAASEGNCTTGTRAPVYAVEPGSGTTIMAYAGICGPQDVQAHSDAYFHAVSIAQMVNVVTGSGNCSVNVPNNNAAPVVNAGSNYNIPKSTAYILKGTASDVNGDVLTYCWEQTNNEITATQPPVSTNTVGPNYRSVPPSTSPNRYMPSFQNVLAGNLTPMWEVTPSVGRTMSFALTVRDNRTPNGGQTNRDDMTVTVVGSAGPFAVTSQNTDQLVLAPGSSQNVTWNVAGTTANGINTSNVNILLSTDNGQTFGTVLAANTPNDGSEAITLPNISQPNCRIMVEAVGNIYYALNGKNIAIGNYQYESQNVCTDYTFNANVAVPESSTSYSGFAVDIADSFTLSDVNVRVVFTHPNVGTLYYGIRHPSQATGLTRLSSGSCPGAANIDLLYDSQGTAVNCANTTSGAATLPLDPLTTFNGLNSAGSWIFFMTDIGVGDGVTGTWDSITLNLCNQQLVPILATANFGLTDFALYPNPNNGNFNVQFSSDSSNEIKILVHDIQGRKIFSKSYQNTGIFNESLQLNNVQSGVYLVTVQDGGRKEVKRIVVE